MKPYMLWTLSPALLLLMSCSGKKDAGAKQDEKSSQSADASGDANKADSSAASSDSVKIVAADQARAGIRIASVEARTLPELLTLNGQVATNDQLTSHIGAIADGRISAVYVLPGARVRRGSALGQLHSHSVHETVGALEQAFAARERAKGEVQYATQARDRYAKLYSIQAASLEEKQRSEQDVMQAEKNLIDAEANVHMEREHLSELLQVPPDSLTANNLYARELIPIRSPIDGVVISRSVTVGQVVAMGAETFAVSNLSSVWVTATAHETDLSQLRNGASADITTEAFPTTSFKAHVGNVGDVVDPQTRTLPVRLVVPNPGERLRPGMFVSAHIASPGLRTAVFIPEDALQNINGNRVVFVTTDGVTFRPQVVTLGTRADGKAEVTQGLKPGDHIVVEGAFMVKGELLKGTVGDG